MKRQARSARGTGPFAIEARGLAVAWLALLALMGASLGASYLHLGAGNLVAGVGIAVAKTFIVGWWFMHLRRAAATDRAAALIALFLLAVLLALSGIDYLTRLEEPADVQAPQQIEPLIHQGEAAHQSPR